MYTYSKTIFTRLKDDVIVICKKHGEFPQNANYHRSGGHCPKCTESAGERKIIEILEKYDIDYVYQKKFEKCRLKNMLKFDFYIPSFNLCVEYDGKHHFETCDTFSKTEKDLELVKKKDNIKNNFCKDNNIELLRIHYKAYDKIEKIIKERMSL